jgi:lysophospholipase L1-like esterase
MKRSLHYRKTLGVLCGVVLSLSSFGQGVDSTLFILNIGENVISNSGHLQRFYEKLYALKSSGSGTVNILHIGDSHIQADFLTEVVRKNLQAEFGNAGRGLVVPARVAGTNEPFNFRTSSNSKWESKRVVHPSKPLPIGVGGITVSTTEEGAQFNLRMNDPVTDYSFNSITLFFEEGSRSFSFSIQDTLQNELASISSKETSSDYSRVQFSSNYNYVSFVTTRQNKEQQHATVFGLSLENGKPGVLYHSVGVNGAKYEHYNAAGLFARQTNILKPDLIIISLGTNESVEYPHLNKNIESQISRLIFSLNEQNPDAAFILVTPPDSFLRKVKPNPGIETIRMQIIQFAVENGFAFWDMYKVNGGKSSAVQWKMRGLLRADGIHFSREGYAHQGNLLFEAIMKGYNAYVSDRHP